MSVEWRTSLNVSIEPLLRRATAAGLLAAADEALAASQALVPRDTGDLAASGFTQQVDDETAAVGYRDGKAAEVHENLRYPYHSGQAKYLEQAIMQNRDALLREVAREIRQVTR